MESEKKLNGKVAIVTGAAGGIGKAVAITLAKAGAKVALTDIRYERLADVKRRITELGGTAICVETDVTKRCQVKQLVQKTETELGPIDFLMNIAGLFYISLMQNVMEDLWDEQIDVNIKGVTNCIGAVLDGMVSRGSGHIVNMSSGAGRKGIPGMAVYCGTKFYVEGLSQTLRQEVCKLGIKVTCIQPGPVKMEDRAKSLIDSKSAHLSPPSEDDMLEPKDIADAVFYAITQPDNVAVNEVLVLPKEIPF